jgi:hypothetical protein
MSDRYYFVKVKQPGMKRWLFLGRGGYLASRRVHALMFTKAEAGQQAATVRGGGDQAKVTQ